VSQPRRVSLTIPRDTGYLSLVRQVVVELAGASGFAPAATAEIEMAIDEAASNAIRHAAGRGAIVLEADADGDGITVTIHDGGAPFSFDRCGAGDLEAYLAGRAAGGLGVYIIKRFMDEVEYRHRPETGNELRMRKYLCPTSTS
jgi:anti-sigma regulatory factor (Ser/Thr protein kinase)